MKKLSRIALLALLFLLTLQTHYEFTHPTLPSVSWDFGQINLYGTDILLVIALGLMLFSREFRSVRVSYFAPMLAFGMMLFLATAVGRGEPMSWYLLLRFVEGVLLAWMLASSTMPFRQLVFALVLGIAANAVFGAAQFMWQWVPANKWLGLAQQSADVEGAAIVSAGSARYLRAYGFLPYPNILGLYVSIAFTSAIWLFVDRFQTIRKYFAKERWLSIGLLLCVALLALGLLFSFSRSAWLGTSIGCVLVLSATLATRNLRTVYLFGIGIFISAAAVGALHSYYAPLVFNRIEARGGHEIRSIEDRANSFTDAQKLFKGNWLAGIGLGQSSYQIIQRIDPQRPAYQANPVQNLFVLLAVEAGVFSSLAMIAVIWFAFADAFRAWMKSRMSGLLHPSSLGITLLVSLVVMSFFGNYLPTLPSGIFLLFAVLGLCLKSANE